MAAAEAVADSKDVEAAEAAATVEEEAVSTESATSTETEINFFLL